MTLIDDFIRYTVVFLLNRKSEAALWIKQYVRWVTPRYSFLRWGRIFESGIT